MRRNLCCTCICTLWFRQQQQVVTLNGPRREHVERERERERGGWAGGTVIVSGHISSQNTQHPATPVHGRVPNCIVSRHTCCGHVVVILAKALPILERLWDDILQ